VNIKIRHIKNHTETRLEVNRVCAVGRKCTRLLGSTELDCIFAFANNVVFVFAAADVEEQIVTKTTKIVEKSASAAAGSRDAVCC